MMQADVIMICFCAKCTNMAYTVAAQKMGSGRAGVEGQAGNASG